MKEFGFIKKCQLSVLKAKNPVVSLNDEFVSIRDSIINRLEALGAQLLVSKGFTDTRCVDS